MSDNLRIPYGVINRALAYRAALLRRHDWNAPVAVTVVDVCGSEGYNWFELA